MATEILFPLEQSVYSWLMINYSHPNNITLFPSAPPSEALDSSLQDEMGVSYKGSDLPLDDMSLGFLTLFVLLKYAENSVSFLPLIPSKAMGWKLDNVNIILVNILKTLFCLVFLPRMLPVMVYTALIFWLYSLLVKLAYRVKFGSKVIKAEGMDSIWGLESKESHSFITVCLLASGMPDIDKIRRHIATKILDVREANGDYKFRKFRQVFFKKFGYCCWRDAEQFNIEDHVRLINLRELARKNQDINKQNEGKEDGDFNCNTVHMKNCESSTSENEKGGLNSQNECCTETQNDELDDANLSSKSDQNNKNEGTESCCSDARSEEMDEMLKHVLSEAGSETICADRPGWDILLLPRDDNRYNVVFRLHHSMGDGVSFMRLCMECLVDTTLPPLSNLGHKQQGIVMKTLMWVWSVIMLPLGLLQLMANFDKHSLHGPPLSGRRVMLWSKALPLSMVKQLKSATNTTVNDVLTSCLAASFSKYFASRKECVNCVTAAMPISFHDLSTPLTLTNKISIVALKLPTSPDLSSLDRLANTKSLLDSAKRDPTLLAVFWAVHLVCGLLPASLAAILLKGSGISLGCSNVPGPQQHISIWGDGVEELLFWVPNRAPVGMGVSFVSYQGQVKIAFNVDEALVKSREEAQQVLVGVEEELHHLHHTLFPPTPS